MLTLHSDHGGEYMLNDLEALLAEKGIEHKLTMPYSPQQNSLAERWNWTILDKACAMLHSAGLSLGFWELAIDAVVHTYNRTPSRTIGWCTPHELWSDGHVPDVSYFRVFGCKAYMHVPEEKCKKLDPRSIKMTLVGYELDSKGYRLWNSNTQAIILSRNVTFDERSFPVRECGQPSDAPLQPLVLEGPVSIQYNASEPGGPVPPETPQNPAIPNRDNTVFHTPPSRPRAASPLPRVCPIRVQ
jgi:Integrase core domain